MANESLLTDHSLRREQLGGYFLIEAANRDEAIDIAAEFLVRGSALSRFDQCGWWRVCRKISLPALVARTSRIAVLELPHAP
jgi:hypothetical protein